MKKYIKLATLIPLVTIGVGTIVMSGCANNKDTSISINGPENIDGYVGRNGSIDYSAETDKHNDITKTCNWHLEGSNVPTWINIDQQGVLSWSTPASVGHWPFSIIAAKDKLTEGKLDVTLDIESSAPTKLSDVTIGENLRGWALNFDTSDLTWWQWLPPYECDRFYIECNNDPSGAEGLQITYVGGPNNFTSVNYLFLDVDGQTRSRYEFTHYFTATGEFTWIMDNFTFDIDEDLVVTKIIGYRGNGEIVQYSQIPDIRPFNNTTITI